MSNENDFAHLIGNILDVYAANLSELDQTFTPEVLSLIAVEHLARMMADQQTKTKLAKVLEPFVQAWLDGRHNREA